jgi:hypothetical protein
MPIQYRIDIYLIVKLLYYQEAAILFGFGTWSVHV